MWLWIVFAVLTALVIGVLLTPLARRSSDEDGEHGAFDIAVYRDQLSELERDLETGLIAKAEADAARNEVSRRILAAKSARAGAVSAHKGAPTWVRIATVLAIPAIALGVYLNIGRPDLPAQPLAQRLDNAVGNKDMVAMVRQVEKHLEENPKDAQGWQVLGPIYLRMNRPNDAVNAYRQVVALNGPKPENLINLAETMVIAKQGLVEANAMRLFEAALAQQPGNMKARFFIALAKSQEGKTQDAVAMWQSMLDEGPATAPWREAVERQMREAGATPRRSVLPKGPALSREQVKDAQEMAPEDRTAMIRGMVERLDSRLADDGSDLDGWLRLIRARMVLGERDKALEALNRASAAMKDNEQAMTTLGETRKALGL